MGYPDQPLFTPLLVAGLGRLGGGSLAVVRLAAALAAAVSVLLVGGITAEMGGSRRARLVAAACWGVGGLALVSGHTTGTTIFDVLAATGVCWCLARAIRSEDPRWVAAAGVVLGIGLLNKLLVGFVAALLLVALLAVGPRSLLRPRALAMAAVAAVLGAAPYLLWQAAHGWPQLELSRAIAADGAEGGRFGVVPFQVVLVSPVLVPVWVGGLVRLLRPGPGRPFRAFAVAYLVCLPAVILTGGKAYYAAGLLPPLVAAGAIAADGWLARGRPALRRGLLAAGVGGSLVVNAMVGLDVLPARTLAGPVLALNPDAGEQVGWPRFADTVATAWRQLPAAQRADAVIFTGNYGESGAVDRYGPARGLPSAYSGHNAYGLWGPPPDRPGPVVIVGYRPGTWLDARFRGCRTVAHIDNGVGLDKDEQGNPVLVCTGTAAPWSQLWPQLRHND